MVEDTVVMFVGKVETKEKLEPGTVHPASMIYVLNVSFRQIDCFFDSFFLTLFLTNQFRKS